MKDTEYEMEYKKKESPLMLEQKCRNKMNRFKQLQNIDNTKKSNVHR